VDAPEQGREDETEERCRGYLASPESAGEVAGVLRVRISRFVGLAAFYTGERGGD
jgi:hypothetical protein